MFRMDNRQIAVQRAMAAEIGARLGRQHKPQTWLQREAGVPASTWRKYFTDGAITRDVPLSTVQRIAAALGMSTGALIDLAEEGAPDYEIAAIKGLSAAERAELQAKVDEHKPQAAPVRTRRRAGA